MRIMKGLHDNFDQKNAIEIISKEEYYSKTRLSHLFRDIAASSLTDMLTWIRASGAEKLLLTTDMTLASISLECGFSDVKYFNKGFIGWFNQSPFDYRATYKQEMKRPMDVQKLPHKDGQSYLKHIDENEEDLSEFIIAINPVTLKNVGTRDDLFVRLEELKHLIDEKLPEAAKIPVSKQRSGPQEERKKHLIPILLQFENGEGMDLISDGIASFEQTIFTPCLVIPIKSKAATLSLIDALCTSLGNHCINNCVWWLVSHSVSDTGKGEEIALAVEKKWRITPQLIFTKASAAGKGGKRR
jgi:AraC-like DNA-binding protein